MICRIFHYTLVPVPYRTTVQYTTMLPCRWPPGSLSSRSLYPLLCSAPRDEGEVVDVLQERTRNMLTFITVIAVFRAGALCCCGGRSSPAIALKYFYVFAHPPIFNKRVKTFFFSKFTIHKFACDIFGKGDRRGDPDDGEEVHAFEITKQMQRISNSRAKRKKENQRNQ